MIRFQRAVIVVAVALVCGASHAQQAEPKAPMAADKQAEEIRDLIEQLVFVHPKSGETPLLSPGVDGNDEEYKRQFDKCQNAFRKLAELKGAAFPSLVAHLEDARPSIHFRNHYLGHSVGDACYWNLYYQLQDRPKDYSSYGYMRKGRDGEDHPKPYWEGTPFDEAGGLKKWLERRQKLSYAEKQIECLSWLLAKEKAIGAPDADSYFENILPLEIRILERKQETGVDVQRELNHLRMVSKERLVNEVPKELLPEQSSPTTPDK